MQEILPIAAGALVAVFTSTLAARRPRVFAVVALGVALGTAATIASGEFRVSWEFLAVDIPLVLLSALATVLLARRLLRLRPSAAKA